MTMKRWLYWAMFFAFLIVINFYRLDSYIMQPGSAYDVSEFIEVKDAKPYEGTLNLMTIAQRQATPVTYAWALMSSTQEILDVGRVRHPDEDEDEYEMRQQKLMQDSQANAIISAFRYLNKPVEEKFKGVYLVQVVKNGAADGKLQAGDQLTAIDRKPITSMDMLQTYLKPKQLGDEVKVTYERDGAEHTTTILLQKIPGDKAQRIGLGVSFMESLEVVTEPDVKVEAGAIGGPSAGLMFTLGIINALSADDITKGYQVAGTGTIDAEGNVGRIGGAKQKVIAADHDGMEIFFALDAPLEPEYKKAFPDAVTNYEEAVTTAKKIKTDMKIVPVQTLQDAIDYLAQLPHKK